MVIELYRAGFGAFQANSAIKQAKILREIEKDLNTKDPEKVLKAIMGLSRIPNSGFFSNFFPELIRVFTELSDKSVTNMRDEAFSHLVSGIINDDSVQKIEVKKEFLRTVINDGTNILLYDNLLNVLQQLDDAIYGDFKKEIIRNVFFFRRFEEYRVIGKESTQSIIGDIFGNLSDLLYFEFKLEIMRNIQKMEKEIEIPFFSYPSRSICVLNDQYYSQYKKAIVPFEVEKAYQLMKKLNRYSNEEWREYCKQYIECLEKSIYKEELLKVRNYFVKSIAH